MKGRIIHIQREDSIAQANDALRTLSSCGWDVELKEGFNRDSVKEHVAQNGYKVMAGSRLADFLGENENKFWTKVACLMNNVETWIDAVSDGQPRAFFEHDAIGVHEPLWDRLSQVEDFCFLSMAYAWHSPTTLAGKWPQWARRMGGECSLTLVNPLLKGFPVDTPLRYRHNNCYHGSALPPGTAAYIITPRGAEKMLNALEHYGMEQSDFIINSFNVNLQYYSPSVCRYNKVNLSTSNYE